MTWILTKTGRRFDLIDPKPHDIDPEDIAHALSNLCRFTGHTREFYSVAQHCVLVSCLVSREHMLSALLHDATEAYVNDIASPIKVQLAVYRAMEARVWLAVADRFNIDRRLPAEVKHADRVALAMEKRDLMPEHPDPWPVLAGITPAPMRVIPLQPASARQVWLSTFSRLTEGA